MGIGNNIRTLQALSILNHVDTFMVERLAALLRPVSDEARHASFRHLALLHVIL